MDPATARVPGPPPIVFRDGLGERRSVANAAGRESLEVLCIRHELSAVPSFEFALRERVSRLAAFRHAYYATTRSVERLNDANATLALVSDRTTGVRLSDLLDAAAREHITFDINAALYLLRQLVPAVAVLHEYGGDVANGVIGPERLIVTPHARLMIVEHVVGSALEQLRFSRERYWQDLRVPVIASEQGPRLDRRTDILQIGVVALSLVLGRRLTADEQPWRLGDLVASASVTSSTGDLEPLPLPLRVWLSRTLCLDDAEPFETSADARDALEAAIRSADYLVNPSSLTEFLERFGELPPAHDAPTPISAPKTDALAPAGGQASDPHVDSPRTVVVPAAAAQTENAGSETRPDSADSEDTMSRGGVEPDDAGAPTSVSQPEPLSTAATPRQPELLPFVPRTTHTSAAAHFDSSSDLMSQFAGEDRSHQPATRSQVKTEPSSVTDDFASQFAGEDGSRKPSYRSPFESDESSLTDDFSAEDPSALFEQTEDQGRPRWQIAAAVAVGIVLLGGVVTAGRHLLSGTPAPKTGSVVVNSDPAGATIVVDGAEHGTTPQTLTLAAGAHVLELRMGSESRRLPLTLVAGAQLTEYLELPKTAPEEGQIQIRTQPAGARVTVDGVARGASPITVEHLAPGEHSVELSSDAGTVKNTVTVQRGGTASILVPLVAEGAPVSGWLAVTAPVEMQVLEDGRLIGTTQTDRIMMSAGTHQLEIKNDAVGYRATRSVQVVPGKVVPVQIKLPNGTIAVNAVPWAEVWIDGTKAGDTPIGNLPVSVGQHEIVLRHPELGEQRQSAVVTLNAPLRLSIDMRKK